MNLEQYCRLVYDSTISAAGLPRGTEAEISAFVDDLAGEFRQRYAEGGYPNGESEEELVDYLINNVQFQIEETRKEGRGHG